MSLARLKRLVGLKGRSAKDNLEGDQFVFRPEALQNLYRQSEPKVELSLQTLDISTETDSNVGSNWTQEDLDAYGYGTSNFFR